LKNTPVEREGYLFKVFNINPVEKLENASKIENYNMFGDFVSQ